MTTHHLHQQRLINSTGTRQLVAQIDPLRRRQPALDDTIEAIRRGDDSSLHDLVVRAQRGDSDAAVTAIWALLPRLAAVVISRLPIQEWHQGIDDYLSFAYLAIIDVDTNEPSFLLGDKIISRTRRRYERAMELKPVMLCGPGLLGAIAPTDTDVEARALATIYLKEVIDVVRGGLLEKHAWDTLIRTQFESDPGTTSARERKTASRAQHRLIKWSKEAA